jgi:hypothetical protein
VFVKSAAILVSDIDSYQVVTHQAERADLFGLYMADAPTNDVATDAATQQDPASVLANQVQSSYTQTGASDQTLMLVREYVDALIQ